MGEGVDLLFGLEFENTIKATISPTSNHLIVSERQTPFKIKLDDIVRNLRSDHEVWKFCHACGWRLVAAITKAYGKCLTLIKKQHKLKTKLALRKQLQRYRRPLKPTVARLMCLVDQLLDATEHTRESFEMLRTMCDSTDDQPHKIYYRKWQLSDILEFAELVSQLYHEEYKIKTMVVEEITKSRSHEELLNISQAWRKPLFALTRDFSGLFKEFIFETSEIKVDC